MAQRIGVKQPAISKLENGDCCLALETLPEVVTALSGEWELTVKLPNSEAVRLVGSETFSAK
jgi:predicted transcriptional regulator